jgi:6-phosphogluconate dehydrogenase (decarboxylating)
MDLTDNALGSPDFKDILPVNNSVTINELRETSKSVNAYAPAFEIAANIREDKSDKFVLGKRTIAAVRNQFGGHKVEKK